MRGRRPAGACAFLASVGGSEPIMLENTEPRFISPQHSPPGEGVRGLARSTPAPGHPRARVRSLPTSRGRRVADLPNHNLPPRPRSIIGREHDLALARERLLD